MQTTPEFNLQMDITEAKGGFLKGRKGGCMRLTKQWLFVIGICLCICGCRINDSDSVESYYNESISEIDAAWGVDDGTGTSFEYLRDGEVNPNNIRVSKTSNALRIYSDNNEISANYDSASGSYKFKKDYRGLNIECKVSASTEKLNMDCEVADSVGKKSCKYYMKASGGFYKETDNTCTDVIHSMTVFVGDGPKAYEKIASGTNVTSWSHECNRYDYLDPEICPSIVNIDGMKYYYKNSCSTEAENKSEYSDNVLRVVRVYSEDEKEGCFLFICNGPWGNLHIVLLPYNKYLIDSKDKIATARNIRSYLDKAPVSSHTMLRGAYATDDSKQCEWYETDIVGYQDIYYDDNIIWDWNKFCIGGKCPYKLMFVVWESDEGWWDDYVGYGVIKRDNTNVFDPTYYMPEFKIAFMTEKYDWPNPLTVKYDEDSAEVFWHAMEVGTDEWWDGSDGVVYLHPDPNSDTTLWLSLNSGRLVKWNHAGTLFDVTDDVFTDYSPQLVNVNINGDYDVAIEQIIDDGNGNLLFAGKDQVLRYTKSGKWETVFYDDDKWIECVQIGNDGKIYIADSSNNYFYLDSFGWHEIGDIEYGEYIPGDNLGLELWGGTCKTMINGTANDIWIGTQGDGLYHLDLKSHIITKQDFWWEEDINEDGIDAILILPSGNFLIGTSSHGLFLWDRAGGSTEHYAMEECCESIYDMFQDADQRVWIAKDDGIYFFDGASEFGKVYHETSIRNIIKDRLGRYWIGNSNIGNSKALGQLIIKN